MDLPNRFSGPRGISDTPRFRLVSKRGPEHTVFYFQPREEIVTPSLTCRPAFLLRHPPFCCGLTEILKSLLTSAVPDCFNETGKESHVAHSTDMIVAAQLELLTLATAVPTVIPPNPLRARYSMNKA